MQHATAVCELGALIGFKAVEFISSAHTMAIHDLCSYLERWSWRSWAAIAGLEQDLEELKSDLEKLWCATVWLANTMDKVMDKVLEKRVPRRKGGRIGRKRSVLKRCKKRLQK